MYFIYEHKALMPYCASGSVLQVLKSLLSGDVGGGQLAEWLRHWTLNHEIIIIIITLELAVEPQVVYVCGHKHVCFVHLGCMSPSSLIAL